MPSVINSDDGVVSGTAGLKTSGSNDGITVFQQNGTESARITAAGNVGIGTSSPGAKLHVSGQSRVADSSNAANYMTFGVGANAPYGNASISTTTAGLSIVAEGAGNMTFLNNGSERMRIDSSGNVGIGTSSPVGKVESKTATVFGGSADYAQKAFVANIPYSTTNVISSLLSGWDGSSIHGVDVGYTYNGTGYNLIFSTNDNTSGNPIERARIDSSGRFFVGVTSQQGGGSHCFQAGSGVNSLQMQNNGATPYGPYINFSAAAPNNASQYFIQCTDTAATRMILYANGGLANYSANNVNLSDRREKTNFAPAKSYLDTICAIPVQTFNYIDQNLEEDDGLTLGVVAQDVQEVAPELVMESNWGTEEEPKMRLSIYQTDLQYALMKCIQELKAELDATKAEVTALKAAAAK